ncbi:MAG: cytochrome P460 family protein [candidate division NC10 bacterium]|nr:cytochrome P460 family protein [candidate division NC10 bacterium]
MGSSLGLRTGEFPDSTIMILKLVSAAVKREPGLQGSFQNEFVGLEAAVKDRQRFDTGWAYFSFDDESGKLKDKARALSQGSLLGMSS